MWGLLLALIKTIKYIYLHDEYVHVGGLRITKQIYTTVLCCNKINFCILLMVRILYFTLKQFFFNMKEKSVHMWSYIIISLSMGFFMPRPFPSVFSLHFSQSLPQWCCRREIVTNSTCLKFKDPSSSTINKNEVFEGWYFCIFAKFGPKEIFW